jgi:isocitrate/isopropylmalate dehydrogenase
MMLAYFGETEAVSAIERQLEEVLTKPEYLTPDVSGKATPQIVGKAIANNPSK